MSFDISSLDLVTINAVREVIVSAIERQSCTWEQQSGDAVADGRLSNALMLEHWAFAADVMGRLVACECSGLLGKALTARMDPLDSGLMESRLLDSLAVELASHQPEPQTRLCT